MLIIGLEVRVGVDKCGGNTEDSFDAVTPLRGLL